MCDHTKHFTLYFNEKYQEHINFVIDLMKKWASWYAGKIFIDSP